MSSKQTIKNSNVDILDPRIAPKEMIITRRKSALQKRQLRNKDRSMKAITQLLKGPPKSPTMSTIKPPQKKVKVKEKPPQKKMEQRDILKETEKEFYPNTLKRKIAAKKIMLKPKYNMKVIAGTNKRKLGTPHRGLKSPPPFKSHLKMLECEFVQETQRQQCQNLVRSHPELSMSDVINLAEEAHSLDDEDLMEILTCPSPVWWEDPPDGYDEDAMFIDLQIPENKDVEDIQPISNEHKQTDKQIGLNINIENRDNNFKQKRSKLENLLGSIKNKISGCDNVPPNSNMKAKISPQLAVDKRISESNEEEMFSDISMNEEDVLEDLESIDIPIESNDNVEVADLIRKETKSKDIPKKMPQLKRCPVKIEDSSKNSTVVETFSSDFDSISDTNVRFIEDDDGSKTSDSSPKKNTKTVNRNVRAKRKVIPVEPEKNLVTVLQSVDKEIVSDLGLNQNADNEFITVYKIMSTKSDSPNKEDLTESNEQPIQRDTSTEKTKNQSKDNELNLFFKKCKNTRRRKKINKIKNDKKSIITVMEPDKNSMLVSENNKVKYCYKCSSIFDTDECSYCNRKSEDDENPFELHKHSSFKGRKSNNDENPFELHRHSSCKGRKSNNDENPCELHTHCYCKGRKSNQKAYSYNDENPCKVHKHCSCKGKCICDENIQFLTCHLCGFKAKFKHVFIDHLLLHYDNKDENECVTLNNSIKPAENQVGLTNSLVGVVDQISL